MTTHDSKRNLPMFRQETPRYAFSTFEEAIRKLQQSDIGIASVLVGTQACNARCAFCVSKMTPSNNMPWKEEDINWGRFTRFLQYVKAGHTSTIMLTGKGEPTLYPEEITKYLEKIQEAQKSLDFHVQEVELQSNGIRIIQLYDKFKPFLEQWASLGLTTMAISIVHFDAEINRQTYSPHKSHYIDLSELISILHQFGIRVRLACIMFNGAIDSAGKLQQLLAFAKANKVEELTVRPVNQPEHSRNESVSSWIREHHLTSLQQLEIETFLRSNGIIVKEFDHGALVFDVEGQNVCLTNSLTPVINKDNHIHYRQLIFYPNGQIMTDWTDEGEQLP